MVLGVGGPHLATLTCLATVVTASLAGSGAASFFERLTRVLQFRRPARPTKVA
jgi:hypothetical protein